MRYLDTNLDDRILLSPVLPYLFQSQKLILSHKIPPNIAHIRTTSILRTPCDASIAQGIKKSSPYVKKQKGGTTSSIDHKKSITYMMYECPEAKSKSP